MESIIIFGLAIWQAVETWHHGSIFATGRARCRLWLTSEQPTVRWLGELTNCMFCLSHWVGLVIVSAGLLTGFFSGLLQLIVTVLINTLAAVRVAQLGNDLAHAFTRSPPSDVMVVDETVFNEPADPYQPDSSLTGEPNERS